VTLSGRTSTVGWRSCMCQPRTFTTKQSGLADIVFTVDETGHTRDFRVLKTSYLYFR
jgi:hypothetical protein